MAKEDRRPEKHGAFIACGAAGVSFDDDTIESTSVDHLIAALKRFVQFVKSHLGKGASERDCARRGVTESDEFVQAPRLAPQHASRQVRGYRR